MTGARMAAIFRADLPLPPGKLAAQAGHAFLTSWRRAVRSAAETYADAEQTKVVLVAPDEAALRRIAARATERGVACALITDAGRTVLPEPAVTVLGLGPMTRTDYNSLTRGLELMT
jgi:peptidyl-tRNA hydrolase